MTGVMAAYCPKWPVFRRSEVAGFGVIAEASEPEAPKPGPIGTGGSGPVQPPIGTGGERRAGHDSTPPPEIAGFTWSGEVSPQKWMNFYTNVLSKFATGPGLRLTVTVEVSPTPGLAATKLEETRNALRELGLDENIQIKER